MSPANASNVPLVPTATSTATPVSRHKYVFQANASDNVAVYYGSSPATKTGDLLILCENQNVDIINLAFLMTFFGPSGYPPINFGPGCAGSTPMQEMYAPGLSNCSALAPEIAVCQKIGKKVLVSLGGYSSNTRFSSDDQANQFAATLWNLFGAGDGENPELRPFGPHVVVDGFDIDNENHDSTFYQTFATALRTQYLNDLSKTYYISAAPQCPRLDASIPLGAMLEADFVWVQFYNNPSCNIDSVGFIDSFAAWASDLTSASASPGFPKLFIGVPAWPGGGSGYVVGSGLETIISGARAQYRTNFGGIMLWDGSAAMMNVDEYQNNYLVYAKGSLVN
ncbi:hypothetical protein LTR28_003599 [Elasticomyces elasticus]|nr:hypothetical protein LTR28_003599 [Elasticomyces elasticus]